ncbi:MAG: hypothetical protein WC979_01690 [Candidatus Pacearchaeota archaeon]|jgi:hypothetical protein|nr:hypothetical protein [Clostridia bacterium]
MPHHFDFNAFEKSSIKELEIANLAGWLNPITIEYANANFAGTKTTVYWRIKGTSHTFTIPSRELNVISKGDHEAHYRDFLKNFREDLIEWSRTEEQTEWMREYLYMYRNYITF